MSVNKKQQAKTLLLVLIVSVLLGIALSVFIFYHDPNRTCATYTIQFSFDGAADGIAPNNTRFDIKDIFSDSIIGEALKNAGFDSRYTVEQVKAQLEVNGKYPKDINDQLLDYDSLLDFSSNRAFTLSQYHPTMYTVSLYNDFDKTIARSDLEALLNSIMVAYQNHFKKTFSANIGSTEIEFNLDDYDYLQQLTILTQQMSQTSLYAQELFQKDPTFLYGGAGFNDIVVRLDNLINNDIDRMNATITISALTKDTNRLMTQYQYEIKTLSNELEKQTECLEKLDQLIASYNKNEILYISTADSLTKIDGNSSKTYDTLIEQRRTVADGITDLKTKIATYTTKLSDLFNDQSAATGVSDTASAQGTEEGTEINLLEMTEEEIAALSQAASDALLQKNSEMEKNIDLLVEKYQAIMLDFSSMVDAYNDKIINEATVEIAKERYYTPSLISSHFILTMIKVAGPICSIGLIVCMIMIIVRIKKEQRTA